MCLATETGLHGYEMSTCELAPSLCLSTPVPRQKTLTLDAV